MKGFIRLRCHSFPQQATPIDLRENARCRRTKLHRVSELKRQELKPKELDPCNFDRAPGAKDRLGAILSRWFWAIEEASRAGEGDGQYAAVLFETAALKVQRVHFDREVQTPAKVQSGTASEVTNCICILAS